MRINDLHVFLLSLSSTILLKSVLSLLVEVSGAGNGTGSSEVFVSQVVRDFRSRPRFFSGLSVAPGATGALVAVAAALGLPPGPELLSIAWARAAAAAAAWAAGFDIFVQQKRTKHTKNKTFTLLFGFKF